MDSNKKSNNWSVNQTGQNLSTTGVHDLHDQIMLIKNMPSGKYKDVQDLRLKILQILEEIRILRQENTTARSVRYYRELENKSNELDNLMCSVIRG